MFDITRINPGEMPYAKDWNKIIDTLESLVEASREGALQHFFPSVEIFELTADPTLDANWGIYTATAKKVRAKWTSSTAGDYETQTDYPTETVWFVCPSDSTAPSQKDGDRVSTIVIDNKRVVIGGGGGSIKIGKLDGDLNYGSTATVSVWTGAVNSESDSDENVTGVGCRHLSSGKKLASGSWVTIAQTAGGQWYVIAGPCEVAQ